MPIVPHKYLSHEVYTIQQRVALKNIHKLTLLMSNKILTPNDHNLSYSACELKLMNKFNVYACTVYTCNFGHTNNMLVILMSPACATFSGTLGLHTYQCQLATTALGGGGPTYTASVTTRAGGTCEVIRFHIVE